VPGMELIKLSPIRLDTLPALLRVGSDRMHGPVVVAAAKKHDAPENRASSTPGPVLEDACSRSGEGVYGCWLNVAQ